MSFGLILLVVVTVLVLFGVGQRVLDRMKLNDKVALAFMAAIIAGSFIPDISLGRDFSINVGGALVPLILVVYLFISAESSQERIRGAFAAIITAAAVYAASKLLPSDPEEFIFDPNYLYGILAGIVGYLFGRSRRSAFIAGILGVILADITQGIVNAVSNIPSKVRLGGAGAFDAVVLSGIIAVLLAEVIGEFREKMQGGTTKKEEELANIGKRDDNKGKGDDRR